MSESGETVAIKPFSSEIDIPFESERHANIIAESLLVDWRHESANFAGGTLKNIKTEGTHMLISFQSDNAKHLRVNINSILEFVLLLIDTVDIFDILPSKSTSTSEIKDNGDTIEDQEIDKEIS